MTGTATEFNANNTGGKSALRIVSDQWGVFGPTFKIDIPVTDRGGGLYEIARGDWDATIGPLFDHLRGNILQRTGHTERAAGAGYQTMMEDDGQIQAFHDLMCAFSAAIKPDGLAGYPGTVDSNPYLRKLSDFAAAYNGTTPSVLVTRTQLSALADAARGLLEYVREQDDESPREQELARSMMQAPGLRYSGGIINALT